MIGPQRDDSNSGQFSGAVHRIHEEAFLLCPKVKMRFGLSSRLLIARIFQKYSSLNRYIESYPIVASSSRYACGNVTSQTQRHAAGSCRELSAKAESSK
ncbi:hypothetical protein EVAR_50353_1 [Eumeta japonica]|uniref:Uncharacterized protein n=1 Tax=Eumeta variegata TaxID=151549 RepID=A0A4C1XX97_EUMVA|nr:hypothetical protein EVAR_50353_1 [Eumeta japonica]